MSRFNPGDIAITTRHALAFAHGNPVIEAGSQVKLLARGERGEEFAVGEVTYRLRNPMWVVERDGLRAIVAERHLIPLRGDFTPEREKSSEVPA
ncbi:conserved protein of unknown function [Ectopseudomonas oleovorans]|uniref:Uncharacterized protein n=1 Tax=Ectopseudomonas oleovorans TaxID=301 RepID=A0A653B0F1_ECTOL|nr:conserved protein of unknown function [Pseudomonas oleovorans]